MKELKRKKKERVRNMNTTKRKMKRNEKKEMYSINDF